MQRCATKKSVVVLLLSRCFEQAGCPEARSFYSATRRERRGRRDMRLTHSQKKETGSRN